MCETGCQRLASNVELNCELVASRAMGGLSDESWLSTVLTEIPAETLFVNSTIQDLGAAVFR
ncbi:hypothetical protein N7470_008914 [Penicillium chermesinum]|nr:hypothetical protein N7470_008914 [Penicillium chermesinum]